MFRQASVNAALYLTAEQLRKRMYKRDAEIYKKMLTNIVAIDIIEKVL